MNRNLFFFIAGIFLMAASGCKDTKKADESETDQVISEGGDTETWKYEDEAANMPLPTKIDTLIYAMDSLKKAAFASEEIKLSSGEKLVDEVKQSIGNYDPSSLSLVLNSLKEMQLKKYSEATMNQEEAMLLYDEANEKFITALQTFVEETEEFNNHARAKLLLKDIITANDSDFMLRKNYNEKVYEYNRILDNKKDHLKSLGEKYQNLTPYPLFYGEPAS